MAEPLKWYEDRQYLIKQCEQAQADMAYHIEHLDDARERSARATQALVAMLQAPLGEEDRIPAEWEHLGEQEPAPTE
jgi:hypothetical protein